MIVPLAVAVSLVFAASAQAYVYWGNYQGGMIGRANLDGSSKNLAFVTNIGVAPCSIAIDNGHIYWGNTGLTSYIGRASLAGNSKEDEWVNLGTYTPCGVATNSANVFFANTGFLGGHAHEIGRVDINGTSVPDKSIIGEAEGPCGLTVFGSQLYWANQGNGTIGAANTDATAVNESLVATGGNEICGIAVDSGYSPIVTPAGTSGGGSSGSPSPSSSPPPSPPTPFAGMVHVTKVKYDKKKGTAGVSLTVNEAGAVAVTGKGVVAASAKPHGAETVTVTMKAAKSKQTSLKRAGELKVKLAIRFTPGNGGATASASKSITLRKR